MYADKYQDPPCTDDCLVEMGLRVLLQPDPWKKAEYTYVAVSLWMTGEVNSICNNNCKGLRAPDRPSRSDDTVKLLPPGMAPKRGKGGSLASRQAILHSLVHIECWAVDLAWDAVVRYGLQQAHYQLPKRFFDDFVTVAEDEARHFSILVERLKELGSYYGALPAHDGLWESARETGHSLPARMAVEHCVHEARGLDRLPATIANFRKHGDEASAKLLENVIYPEEVSHCAAGVRWLKYLHALAHGKDPYAEAPNLGSGDDSDPKNMTELEAAEDSEDGERKDEGEEEETKEAKKMEGKEKEGREKEGKEKEGRKKEELKKEELKKEELKKEEQEKEESKKIKQGILSGEMLRDKLAVSEAQGEKGEEVEGKGIKGTNEDSKSGSDLFRISDEPFDWISDARLFPTVEEWFHALTRRHFYGGLKPPFNEEARARAGFGPEW
eukprot:CAMPEP_0175076838 /NCGR_PEP_ID=MMETSP0052_2-20121109/22995_1 /TAXON_ID=51329 ORGANISM="Polytomella parva, Strain SAG 63-3" /NCGR_SAMPLE_ID=MMETSP0052_2 /ASSEMBLY_ACC=CAM_ASM_000194 /LENGTH=440 /DNA_ID=CAMNT_0016346113 /DNA_START=106 /DNA_END=1425 /DNA_ORIENTATION=-